MCQVGSGDTSPRGLRGPGWGRRRGPHPQGQRQNKPECGDSEAPVQGTCREATSLGGGLGLVGDPLHEQVISGLVTGICTGGGIVIRGQSGASLIFVFGSGDTRSSRGRTRVGTAAQHLLSGSLGVDGEERPASGRDDSFSPPSCSPGCDPCGPCRFARAGRAVGVRPGAAAAGPSPGATGGERLCLHQTLSAQCPQGCAGHRSAWKHGPAAREEAGLATTSRDIENGHCTPKLCISKHCALGDAPG